MTDGFVAIIRVHLVSGVRRRKFRKLRGGRSIDGPFPPEIIEKRVGSDW